MLKGTVTHQGHLEQALTSIFSSYGLQESRKEIALKHPNTGKYLEVDIWYPHLKICFEYQDIHHYQPTWYQQEPLTDIQARDYTKQELLLQRQETLILVPCWWDGSLSNLQATIHFYRPDLQLTHDDNMITINPPPNFFPDDSQLMLASFPYMDLRSISELNPWWLGEKYDGVRCYWNPSEKQMYSRNGHVFNMPPSVLDSFGASTMDGEIWCGRGFFLEANFLIRSSLDKPNWALFRVVCFDEASQFLNNHPFEQRYSVILAHYPPDHPTTVIAPRFLCGNVQQFLQMVVDEGGEGVIIRRPGSRYRAGRSTDLIKLKGSRGDKEGVVVEVAEDGSLVLQLPADTTFVVPATDVILHRKACVGDVVSFTFHSTSSQHATHDHAPLARAQHATDVPFNAIVYRIRDDLTWKDIASPNALPQGTRQMPISGSLQPNAAWNYDQAKRMRAHLASLANAKGFDPLVAENWYSCSHHEFAQDPVLWRFMSENHAGDSLAKAVRRLFPELKLDISKFASTSSNLQKEREAFEQFARDQGGNPMDPRFWYSLRVSEMPRELKTAIFYHRGYKESLAHLFPELNLVKSEFQQLRVKTWKNKKDVRDFFDRFAKAHGFDALVPDNWYNVPPQDLEKYQDKNEQLYEGKLSNFLLWLYPDIGLQHSKFKDWELLDALHEFTRLKGGDPKDPQFWYSIKPSEFANFKGLRRFTSYDRFVKSVVGLFPDLHLDKGKFEHSMSHWKDRENRKKAFTKFATVHSFDPLVADNWYQVSPADLDSFEETHNMLRYYEDKFVAGLVDLFPELHLDATKFVHLSLKMEKNKKEIKQFFDNFAKTQPFDPLVPKNWYNVSWHALQKNEYSPILHEERLSNIVMWLYPNIGLQHSDFGDSKQVEKLRQFAYSKGGNPLSPQFWYSLNPKEFADIQGMKGLMHYAKYVNSVVYLFPELRLKKRKFMLGKAT